MLPGARAGLLLAIAAAMLAGCATQADLEQVQNDQARVRGIVASQSQQIQSLQQQIRRQHDELEELRHGLGGDQAGGQGLNQQLASLQDRLNKLEAAVNALQASAGAVAPGVAPPPPGVPPVAAAPAASGPPAWQADLDRELQAAPSGQGARVYREGLQQMKEGKYAFAVGRFALLQKRYPKSPLVESAEYFSANALFELTKYEQSILQFNDLAMRFPKGRFACAGLLREAQAFQRLNDKIDARLTAQKLIADCDGTAEAASAGALMKDLQN